MSKEQSKAKNIIFTFTMVIVTIVICFVILEFGFANYYDVTNYRIYDKMFDEQVGWKLRPGSYMVKPPHSFKKHEIYVNHLGIRNPDLDENNDRDKVRIVFLGDSFVTGRAVPQYELFTTRVEQQLNWNSDTEYEVINTGIPGYGTGQQLLFMRQLAEKGVRGDLYVLMLCTNDIIDVLRLSYADLKENPVRPGFALQGNNEVVLDKHPVFKEFKSSSFVSARKQKSFKLLSVLKVKVESLLQTRPDLINRINSLGFDVKFPRFPGLLNGWYRDDILNQGLPLLTALVGQIKAEVEQQGAKLIVGIVPSSMMIYPETYGPILKNTFPDSDLVDKWLQDATKPCITYMSVCQQLQIPTLDLYPALRQNNDLQLYVPEEGHFSAIGHAVAAESLYEFIAGQLVPIATDSAGLSYQELSN